MAFFFFLGGEFILVVLPSLCGGCVFVFDVPYNWDRGILGWGSKVCCLPGAFPLVTLMLLPLSFEGAVMFFPIFASSPGLMGESPFLKFYPPFILEGACFSPLVIGTSKVTFFLTLYDKGFWGFGVFPLDTLMIFPL